MTKPRIIIADTDVQYIIPIQSKFAEDFFGKIDIEVITNAEYFNAAFSTPRKVDVLLVSEDLYNSSLHKCNIDNIFVLDEQEDGEQTGDLYIYHIFKYYSNIKEFFNEILGKSGSAFHLQENIEQETNIILFYSASGGVGKTTSAIGVSGVLAQNYKRVLYINAARLQVFQNMLTNTAPITAPDVYDCLKNADGSVYHDIKHIIRKESFSYLPPFQAELMSLGIDYSIFEKIAISAKKSGDYDYIIIDADTVYDEEKAALLNLADRVFIITQQNAAAVLATNILASVINGINSDKYIFVCNDFDKDEDNALISPKTPLRFSVNGYINHFIHYEQMGPENFSKEHSIQEMAFLIS